MKRRLFSNNDGTSFFEDLRDVFSDATEAVRLFFAKLFGNIRNWYDEVGEPVVVFLEALKSVIQSGSTTGNILDNIVASTPVKLDDVILNWLRTNLPIAINKWQGVDEIIDDAEGIVNDFIDQFSDMSDYQQNSTLNALASILIEDMSESIAADSGASPVKGVDANTLAQLSYDMYKNKV